MKPERRYSSTVLIGAVLTAFVLGGLAGAGIARSLPDHSREVRDHPSTMGQCILANFEAELDGMPALDCDGYFAR